MCPRIDAYFRFFGDDFDPNVITQRLQIVPTRAWRNGEIVLPATMPKRDSRWSLCIGPENGWHVDVPVKRVLSIVSPLSGKIRDLCKEHKLRAEVSCAVYFDSRAPSVAFDRETLVAITQLGASLDIDLYPGPDTEDGVATHPDCGAQQ